MDTLPDAGAITLKNDVLPSDSLVLGCGWSGGDVSSVSVLIAAPPAEQGSKALSELSENGYSCTDADGGTTCVTDVPQDHLGNPYAVQSRVTYRSGTWLSVNGSNVDIDALFTEVTAQIWG